MDSNSRIGADLEVVDDHLAFDRLAKELDRVEIRALDAGPVIHA